LRGGRPRHRGVMLLAAGASAGPAAAAVVPRQIHTPLPPHQILVANNRTGPAAEAGARAAAGRSPSCLPNPLLSADDIEEGHEVAAVAYRYRKVRRGAGGGAKWCTASCGGCARLKQLLDPSPPLRVQFAMTGDITLVARTTVHAVSARGVPST